MCVRCWRGDNVGVGEVGMEETQVLFIVDLGVNVGLGFSLNFGVKVDGFCSIGLKVVFQFGGFC